MINQFPLIIFPIFTYISFFIYLNNRFVDDGTRQNSLRAAIVSATYLVIVLELLSLVKGITPLGLTLGFSLPIIVVTIWLYPRLKTNKPIHLPAFTLPRGGANWLMLAIIVCILIVTFVIAWVIPPQTWDSLTYHVSRIAHWAQNRSVWHYATGIERQNSMSPGAEMIALGFYSLVGSDRLANFPQWLAMLGSLIAVSQIAKYLGASTFGQWLTAAMLAVLPIGIVESTSTITDYVAAFWLACVASETLFYYRTKHHTGLVFLCLAAGLGFLTKPIVLPYMLSFALLLGVLLLRKEGVLSTLKWTFIATLLVCTINFGYLTRNIITDGSLSNPIDFINHTNQLLTPAGVVSNLVKNVGLHAGLPNASVYNEFLSFQVLKIHVKLGLEIQDQRTTGDGIFGIRPPVTSEDLTSNPYHAYLMLLTFPLILLFRKRVGWLGVLYSCLVVVSFVIYCGVFKWHVFNVRYHILFFVLFIPALGLFWSKVKPNLWGVAIGLILFLLAYPWLTGIPSRPLLSESMKESKASIFSVPRQRLYLGLASQEIVSNPFLQVADPILDRECNQVGLMLKGDDPEYIFWALLGAPRRDLQMEWIVAGTPSAKYERSDFKPCAVICRDCGASQTIRGVHYVETFGDFELFLNP